MTSVESIPPMVAPISQRNPILSAIFAPKIIKIKREIMPSNNDCRYDFFLNARNSSGFNNMLEIKTLNPIKINPQQNIQNE
jgi:hypothetical protein